MKDDDKKWPSTPWPIYPSREARKVLAKQARHRNISPEELAGLIVEVVARDGLINAVMDGDSTADLMRKYLGLET